LVDVKEILPEFSLRKRKTYRGAKWGDRRGYGGGLKKNIVYLIRGRKNRGRGWDIRIARNYAKKDSVTKTWSAAKRPGFGRGQSSSSARSFEGEGLLSFE